MRFLTPSFDGVFISGFTGPRYYRETFTKWDKCCIRNVVNKRGREMLKFVPPGGSRRRASNFILARICSRLIWFILDGRRELDLRGVGKHLDVLVLTPSRGFSNQKDFRWVISYLKTPLTYKRVLIIDYKTGRELLGRKNILFIRKNKYLPKKWSKGGGQWKD